MSACEVCHKMFYGFIVKRCSQCQIETCDLCKKEFAGAPGALFCSKECLDKWREFDQRK